MFLYPLAIALIVLTLFSSKFHHSKIIYQCTIFFYNDCCISRWIKS
ncbi:branched-chain amino acid transport system II carrier protein [Staphylococcus aureus]